MERFEREVLSGFVNPHTFRREAGIEVLRPDGNLSVLSYHEVKTVRFVREFLSSPASDEQKLFATRPKRGGLWVRMRFRDEDLLDGLLPNDLLAAGPTGWLVLPPDAAANTQRLFVPRLALTGMQVIAVVGSPLRPPRRVDHPEREQIEMFE